VQDVHCVLDGMVKLLVRSGRRKERIFELVGAGQTFGEGLVFLDQPSPGRAVAIDAGQLLVVPGRLLVGTIETSPGFAVRMLRRVSQRIGRLLAELESDTAHSAAQRIVRWLAAQAGAETGETVVRLDVSKATLAALLNTTPETFSRVLQHLRRQGIVRVDRQNIIVLDPVRLRSLHPCVFCQKRRTPTADDAADAGLDWEQLAAARFACDVPHWFGQCSCEVPHWCRGTPPAE
jgi:CRP-like cAMP-binding protein